MHPVGQSEECTSPVNHARQPARTSSLPSRHINHTSISPHSIAHSSLALLPFAPPQTHPASSQFGDYFPKCANRERAGSYFTDCAAHFFVCARACPSRRPTGCSRGGCSLCAKRTDKYVWPSVCGRARKSRVHACPLIRHRNRKRKCSADRELAARSVYGVAEHKHRVQWTANAGGRVFFICAVVNS